MPRLRRSSIERCGLGKACGPCRAQASGSAERMLRWYLIRTKSAGESLAVTNLDRQGYEVYWPRAVQTVRCNSRWRDRTGSLFPGYVFLRLNEGEQALNPVNSTVGVLGLVRFGSSYAVVPDRVIHDLQARANPDTGLHRLSDTSTLKAGRIVRIRTGPFDGLQGCLNGTPALNGWLYCSRCWVRTRPCASQLIPS
jgi:transcriptional antiterminator RfaH